MLRHRRVHERLAGRSQSRLSTPYRGRAQQHLPLRRGPELKTRPLMPIAVCGARGCFKRAHNRASLRSRCIPLQHPALGAFAL
ncbi:hypothetical protein FKP32DRAFT_555 [Trametes sanguinea]|nr:hypothetical protein FKP32DRAFT_555 [Trametes sanguinea]